MSAFYDDMAQVAIDLLTEFGATITLPRTTGASIDPITGVETSGTDATVTTTGILKRYPDSMIDGTRIQTGDRILILTSEQTPTTDDTPTIGGENWTVVNIETVSPAGTNLVFFVQVRK